MSRLWHSLISDLEPKGQSKMDSWVEQSRVGKVDH